MDAKTLLTDLTANGFALSLDGDRLLLSPAGRVNDRLRALIVQHKDDLIALLTETSRLWLIARPDGSRFSLSRNPPGTLAEIRHDYPGCLVEIETEPTLNTDTERDAA